MKSKNCLKSFDLMFVFRKIWCALFSSPVLRFTLLPCYRRSQCNVYYHEKKLPKRTCSWLFQVITCFIFSLVNNLILMLTLIDNTKVQFFAASINIWQFAWKYFITVLENCSLKLGPWVGREDGDLENMHIDACEEIFNFWDLLFCHVTG